MPFYTRVDLLKELVQELFPLGYLDATAVTSSDNTVSVAAFAELRSSRLSDKQYVGAYFYPYAGTDAGAWRRIELYEPQKNAAWGAVTLQRPLTAPVDNTTKAIVYNGGLTPADLQRVINKAVRRTLHERTIPITLVDDGLMEDAGVTSWPATNAVATKVTDALSVFEGQQALRVTNSGANGYVQSSTLGVADYEVVRLEAECRILNAGSVVTTAVLQLVNVVTGAVLLSVQTQGRDHIALSLNENIPAGTNLVAARLLGVEATADIAWDDVVLWKRRENIATLPDEITDKAQVIDVFRRRPILNIGAVPFTVGTAEPNAYVLMRVSNWTLSPDPAAPGRVAINTPPSGLSFLPLVVTAILPGQEFTDDTSTRWIPNLDDFLAKAKAIAYETLAKAGPHDDRSYYDRQAQGARPGAANAAAYGPRNPRQALRR